MRICLEVIPALIGGIGFGLAGGAGGSAVGNYLSQKYRMSRGLQDEFGLGEFGAATALGGVPVGKFANVGMAGKTAIRAGQGAALATGELTARTFIDEDRAPTPDEVATTLLFGGVFGGTLGAAEAKFLRDGTGADIVEGMTRPQVKDAIASNIKDKGGIENASVGSPLLSQMNFSQLINKKTSDEVTAEVMQGIENKLLQETEQVVQEIDLPDDASPLLNQLLPNLQDRNQARQNLRNAFNRNLQQSDEIFSETNPIVAKGNLADTQRLRVLKAKLDKIDHTGKQEGLRKKLEKEKRALERKHNIVGNVLLGGAGVASVASMFTEEEESELSQAGFDKIIIAGLAALGVGSKLKNKDLIKSAVKGRKQGISEQEQNIVEPERVGKAAVEAESIEATPEPGKPALKKKNKRSFTEDDVRSYYTEELFDTLRKNQDPVNTAIILEELADVQTLILKTGVY